MSTQFVLIVTENDHERQVRYNRFFLDTISMYNYIKTKFNFQKTLEPGKKYKINKHIELLFQVKPNSNY